MATIPPIDNALSKYTRWSPSPAGQQIIQWSLDARRAIVLGKRIASGSLIGHDGPDTRDQPLLEKEHNRIKLVQEAKSNLAPDTNRHSFKTTAGAPLVSDYVAIIDIDVNGYNQGHRIIKLPFIPTELNYNIDSSFAAIRPIARNNAKYHYTGSEDKLEFEIDWHSTHAGRYDVITNCRLIEALAKGDGYNNPPHRVLLQWGTNDVLFKDHIFIITSASYRLVNFNKAQINQSSGAVERTNMLPVQAYQRVSLARVTSTNLLKDEIEYVANKVGTSNLGIPRTRGVLV
jgi:hypothetical protein